MSKFKSFMMICSILVFCCTTSQAQGIRGKLSEQLDGGTRDNQRNDFEGVVWEYKVMDRHEKDKSKKTLMVGRFRVKQSAVFAVGAVEVVNVEPELSPEEQAEKYITKFDADGDGSLNTSELTKLLKSMRKSETSVKSDGDATNTDGGTGSSVQDDLKGLLADRIGRAKEEGTGSERIGEIRDKNAVNCVFLFDQDDAYPLSGRVEVNRDSNQKGGVWSGKYDEYVDGRPRHQWRIELRKIDE